MSGIAGHVTHPEAKTSFSVRNKMHEENGLILQMQGRLARATSPTKKAEDTSDIELLAETFLEIGPVAFSRFSGDFALALYSEVGSELFLYRSSANAPELFILNTNSATHFSSEARLIFDEAGRAPEVNESKLYRYLRFGEGDTNESFFTGLQKVLPGQTVTVTASGEVIIPKQTRKVQQFSLTKADARKWVSLEANTPQALELKMVGLMRKVQEPQTLAAGSYDPQPLFDNEFAAQHAGETDSGVQSSPGLQEALKNWLIESNVGMYYLLMSPEFGERPYFDGVKSSVGFSDFLRDRNLQKADAFWRLANAEIWLREFFDRSEKEHASGGVVDAGSIPAGLVRKSEEKSDLLPNEGKNLDIDVMGKTYRRYPLRTTKFMRGDHLEAYVANRVGEMLEKHGDSAGEWWQKPWHIYVAEKIVAITQTRSFFVWEIEPRWWARKLSSFIKPSSYGYGLSIPWTMELAIREVGLPRILLASAGSVLGKLIGKAGVFYMIAGPGVRAIDGPLESPVYPSFLSAKLAPANTDQAAAQISAAVRQALAPEILQNFKGTVIIDANDVGRHVLGTDAEEKLETLEAVFDDNPLGQGGEKTPVSIVHQV